MAVPGQAPGDFRIYAQPIEHGRGAHGFDTFQVEVDKRMTVLDALEDIRTSQDPTLLYRHSCHHASCGTSAMKVNHREILSCVTNVLDLGTDVVTVEPLGVLPAAADLVVDMTPLAQDIAPAGLKMLRTSDYNAKAVVPEGIAGYRRFENCIECGACVSACPITNTDPDFIGPAAWRPCTGPSSRATPCQNSSLPWPTASMGPGVVTRAGNAPRYAHRTWTRPGF